MSLRRSQGSPPKVPAPLEHVEQSLFFQRVELHPRYRHLPIFAIPNGGHRHKATAAKLKREGVKAGVPDIFVACACAGWNGLFIEMKRKGNKATPAQQQWHGVLISYGFAVETCYSATEAFDVVARYVMDGIVSPVDAR